MFEFTNVLIWRKKVNHTKFAQNYLLVNLQESDKIRVKTLINYDGNLIYGTKKWDLKYNQTCAQRPPSAP